MDKKESGKKRSGCSCAGCLGMIFFMLSLVFFGYFLREWESHDWDRPATVEGLKKRAVINYDNLKGWLTSTPPADRNNPEPDTDPEEAMNTDWTGLGDEAYARARQVWYKAGSAAGEARHKLIRTMIAELQTAARNYESALGKTPDNPALKEKLQTTRKSIAELQKNLPNGQ